MLFLISPFLVQAQERQVSGKVTDAETGDDLPGVNIIIKGTSVGTSTDANGSYRLPVPDDKAILTFSFIGYATAEVPVGNQTTINQQLQSDIKALEEVVVVGYVHKKRLTLQEPLAVCAHRMWILDPSQ